MLQAPFPPQNKIVSTWSIKGFSRRNEALCSKTVSTDVLALILLKLEFETHSLQRLELMKHTHWHARIRVKNIVNWMCDKIKSLNQINLHCFCLSGETLFKLTVCVSCVFASVIRHSSSLFLSRCFSLQGLDWTHLLLLWQLGSSSIIVVFTHHAFVNKEAV